MRGPSGLVLVSLATAIGGAAGYIITWLVPRQIGFTEYVVFAVFWSFLFLVVSALSGIQQEVTRGTHLVGRANRPQGAQAANFGLVASAAVFALTVASAPLWVEGAFPAQGWALVWPLAVGVSTYVLVAVLYGTLYGTSRWQPLFWMMVVEAILRLAALIVLLASGADIVAIAWAVSLPYAATLILLWPAIRARTLRSTLDVGYRTLTWNVARTIAAATSMGVLVSGFPLLLGLTSADAPTNLLGLVILAATLTRAPLIVVTMAFQSYLIVLFRSTPISFWRLFLGLQGGLFGVAAVLTFAGWWLGPPVFAWLFPGELVPGGWLIAALVLSSALVGALCISAPAVLARSGHGSYTLGWVVAAIVTTVCLLMPLDLYSRTVLALIVGPVAGLLVHVAHLVVSSFKLPDSTVL